MPEGNRPYGESFERAMAEVRQEVISQLEARQLSAAEVAGYRRPDYAVGWRVPAEFETGLRHLDLLFSGSFPFTPPEVALVAPPPPLTYPHVERDGKLCLLPDAATVNRHRPTAVTKWVLSEAYSLLADCDAGVNREDFRREFRSYWLRASSSGAKSLLSLLRPIPPSRLVRTWEGENRVIFGDDESSLEAWLRNAQGSKQTVETHASALIWIGRPLLPAEYPRTSNDLLGLVKKNAPDAAGLLDHLTSENLRQAKVVLGMDGDGGPCLAGVTAYEPEGNPYEKAVDRPLERGFRAGRAPHQVIARRFWQASTPVLRSEVSRADAAWIHGRGKDVRQEILSAAAVTLIGCGSVGSHVAAMLAQAGVGRLTLIDPDTLSWANVGRHALGARWVGQFKAEATAKQLRENFPHLSAEYHNCSWEEASRKELGLPDDGQLILCATGNWSVEAALNARQQAEGRRVPIVYGWTEAYACAGQAVAVAGGGGCLECGMTEVGVPRLRVTDWNGATTEQREPACGAVYQPYGPVELSHTNSLIAEASLDVLLGRVARPTHYVWACREAFLRECGGAWSEEWRALPEYQPAGGYAVVRDWPQNPQCLACGNSYSLDAAIPRR
jgi:sulfur-carrier protein adenylyltransferase/sulfurtransferase